MHISPIAQWCDRSIRLGFYLLFILVPLILTPWNYELFEYNKMMITYALATIILGAWGIKMIAEKEFSVAKTPLDIPIALFIGSQLVSSIFSMDPHVSWLGYYSRFNGGMWSMFTYVLLYYAFVTNFVTPSESGSMNHESSKKKKNHSTKELSHTTSSTLHNSIITLLTVALSTGAIVAIYGVLEHMGIDKHLWVQDVQNRVFSTLGQPNWLAAYLVALIPVTWGFAIASQRTNTKGTVSVNIQFIVSLALSLLFFVVLLFSRSRSGLFALAISDLLFWGLVFISQPKQKAVTITALLLHMCFALIVFFNGSNIAQIDTHFTLEGIRNQYKKSAIQTAPPSTPKPSGPALETGGTESGTIRKYVWQGALAAWKSTSKTWLIGTGTETFAFAFYKFRPVGHNSTSEWDFLYNKAHNEYLNYLATTGMFGLISYLLFIGTFVIWFLKKVYTSNRSMYKNILEPVSVSANVSIVSVALFAGWSSVLITNFFGFSVVIVQLFLFLFPAAVCIFEGVLPTSKKEVPLPLWTVWAFFVMSVTLLLRIVLFWYADTLYASGYRDARSGQYVKAKDSLELALTLNPSEPNYHDELATTLASLAIGSYEQQMATQASELARRSLEENARALSISPLNVNYWKSKTKIYYSFSTLNPAFITEAVNALTKAQELSPNDPKIEYNLAILYGRQGNSEKAISILEHAITLKKNYRDPYYALYVFYTEVKQPQKAKNILQTYLQTVDASDAQFTELVKQ